MTSHEYTSIRPPSLDDAAATERELASFLRDVTLEADAEGVVVALSGGLDSTVAATLATEALGCKHVCGLVMPAVSTPERNVDDAIRVAEELVIDHRRIDIQPLVDQVVRMLTVRVEETPRRSPSGSGSRHVTAPADLDRDDYRRAVGNVAARLRMVLTYFEANATNRLVLGTGNRTELLLGGFTKHGNGAADLLPLGDLYESQVRELAAHLSVPESIREKPPTAGLWTARTDESEIGAPYPVVDAVLERLLATDAETTVDELAAELDVSEATVSRCAELHRGTAHKRRLPRTPESYRDM